MSKPTRSAEPEKYVIVIIVADKVLQVAHVSSKFK